MIHGEEQREGEYPMLSAIPVRANGRSDKMFSASRINFGKVYTVEHNVKVYDFGNVLKEFVPQIQAHWAKVLSCDLQGNPPETTSTERERSGEATRNLATAETGNEEGNETGIVIGAPKLPNHGTATFAWTSTDVGQLVFKKDDRILVIEFADDHWAKGRNESTACIGLFPRGLVTLDGPEYATALRDTTIPKKKKDHLAFKKDDRILVQQYESASWDFGYNLTTGKEGKYPQQWVKMDRGTFAIALCDHEAEEDEPERLLFKRKDRILVIHGDAESWSWGRNERTRQEGKFHGTFVEFVVFTEPE
jgi:hypothetical protein